MALPSFIKQLLTWMEEPAEDAAASPLAAASELRPKDQDQRLKRLARVHVGSGAALLAGSLKMIGLSEAREAIGEKWNDIAAQAMTLAEAEIARHLGANELCRRCEDESFVLCFESPSKDVVNAQVERISRAVRRRLLEQLPDGHDLSRISLAISEIDADALASSNDPMNALFAAVMQVREAVGTEATERGAAVLRSARLVFHPLWSADSATINLCMLDQASATLAKRHQSAPEGVPDWLAQLDYVVFAKAAEILHEAGKQAPETTIIVPVQYHTLAVQNSRDEFLRLAAAVPQADRNYICIDIVGIPEAATAKELQLVFAKTSKLLPKIVLRLSPLDHRLAWTMEATLWGVSLSMEDVAGSKRAPISGLVEWVSAAKAKRLRTLAYFANTMAQAHAAHGAGFHHIGGSALHLAVATPKSPARFLGLQGRQRAS